MEDTTKSWKLVALILGILNIVLLAGIWLESHQPSSPMHPMEGVGDHRKPHEMRGGPGNFLASELHFNAEQTKQFEASRDEHRANMRELQHQGKELRDDFFKHLEQERSDSNEVNRLAHAIAINQKNIELAPFHHFKEIRGLCDEEQKIIFDKIIAGVLRMMGRPSLKPDGPKHQ